MVFRFHERPTSRESTANEPTHVRQYVAAGSSDIDFVLAVAMASSPPALWTAYGTLYRQDVRIQPQGRDIFYVDVPYAKEKSEEGDWTWDFDTTGGTVNIRASSVHDGHLAKYAASGAAPDHGGLIGVNGDNVDGTEIIIPTLKINVKFRHPLAVVTIPYAKFLSSITGTVNSHTMLSHDAGEVLFLGASGSDGSDAPADVGYQFACSENLQSQIIAGINVAEKQGWDYLWIYYRDDTDANDKPVQKANAIYVERVYKRVNHAVALGFGG